MIASSDRPCSIAAASQARDYAATIQGKRSKHTPHPLRHDRTLIDSDSTQDSDSHHAIIAHSNSEGARVGEAVSDQPDRDLPSSQGPRTCRSHLPQTRWPTTTTWALDREIVLVRVLDAALDHAASGIRINAVCPGVIDTDMIARLVDNDPDRRAAFESQKPVGRLGTVDEIADAVLWLCSDDNTFTIGHALIVDGGQTV